MLRTRLSHRTSSRPSYTLAWNAAHDAVRIRIAVVEPPPVRIESWGVDLSELPGDAAHWRGSRVRLDWKLTRRWSVETRVSTDGNSSADLIWTYDY